MNIFETQTDFITRDTCFGDPGYSVENSYKRFFARVSPEEVNGATVLDIACQSAAAGGYVLSNGARKYVGVDFDPYIANIARENLKKYYPDADAKVIVSTGEEYVANCKEKFDIVFLGRTVHALHNGTEFFKDIAKITDCVIIETATPINGPAVKLKNMLLKQDLNQDQLDEINQIFKDIEYNECFTEYHHSRVGDYINNMYSMGYLKLFFNQLGFTEDLAGHEYLKLNYSDDFGMGRYPGERRDFLKFVIKFKRTAPARYQSWSNFRGYA
jgi:predicted RNA methylase